MYNARERLITNNIIILIIMLQFQLPFCFILLVLTLLSHFSVCENEGDSLDQCSPIRSLAVNAELISGNNSEIHISFITQGSEITIKTPSYNVAPSTHFNKLFYLLV